MKLKPIFTNRLAGQLLLDGFVLQDLRDNKKSNGFKVFIFKDTPELNKRIEELNANIKSE